MRQNDKAEHCFGKERHLQNACSVGKCPSLYLGCFGKMRQDGLESHLFGRFDARPRIYCRIERVACCKPDDKVTLNISLSGDIDGISAFAYADLDMDGNFEKVLCSSKKAKDSMSVGIKVPKDSRQGKIRVRVRYTSDLSADGADTPVRDGKCYDFVLYVVD